MKILSYILFLFILFGCSEKKSILSYKVEKDPGKLSVLNASGFMGATIADTSIEHTVHVKSQGGLNIENLSATINTNDPISFKGGVFPGIGGTCTSTLKTGETCSLVIMYEPQDTNGHRATLRFTYNDALANHVMDYELSADSHPILSFEYGTLYDFGNKFVGSSTDLRVRISNIGKVIAQSISINNLSAPFSFKGGSYPGVGGTCGSNLVPGNSCDLIVNYSPTGNGEHIQNITLNYLNTGRVETNTLKLIAWGFTQAQLNVSDSSGYDFGTIPSGLNQYKVFTVTHVSGDVSATAMDVTGLSAPYRFRGGTFPGTGGTCSRTLTKDAVSCTIVIEINTTLSGSFSNTLSFNYFNGSSPVSISRSISATTKQKAVISFSNPGTTDFGIVSANGALTKTFTVTYTGGELPANGFSFTSLAAPFSSTGGSCVSSLISGSCTVSITYAPTTYGSNSDSAVFNYHDGATAVAIPVTFVGTTEAYISTSHNSHQTVITGMSQDFVLRLNNLHSGPPITQLALKNLSTSAFAFKGGVFPGTGGTCTTGTISSQSYCTVVMTFSPLTPGSHTGLLEVYYNDGIALKTHSVSFSGTGTDAANLSMPDTNFNTISVNETKSLEITVSNSSSLQATSLSDFNFPSGFGFKGGSFPGIGGTCAGTWSTSCKIALAFSPTSSGSYSGTFSFKYNDGSGNIKMVSNILSGTAIPTDELFLSNFDTIDFGTNWYVGQQSAPITIKLLHGGSSTPVNVANIEFTSGSDFTYTTDCPSQLTNGASCNIDVKFVPLAPGNLNSELKVTYNNGIVKYATRLLKGRSKNPAILNISPVSFNFGAKATDEVYNQTFTVTNSGSENATNMIFSTTPSSGFTIPSKTCSTILIPGGSCTFIVRFSPVVAGMYNGSVSIQYGNIFQTTSVSTTLSGSGEPTAVLAFNSSTYSFGNIIQSQSSTRTLTLTHSGPVPATGITLPMLNPPYSYKGGTCADTLNGASCTILIEFAPTTTGTMNLNFTISFNNGISNKTVTALLTGNSIAQAILSVIDPEPSHFGTTTVNGSIDKQFTVQNGGGLTATALGGAFDSPTFTFRGGSFPGIGGNCTSSLPAGLTCSIVLSFKPTEARFYNSTFTLNYYDGLRLQTEFQNITGLASLTLQPDHYFSLLENMEFELKKEKDDLLSSPYLEYRNRVQLREGTLSGIYKKEGREFYLKGYILRAKSSRQLIEKFLELD